MGKQILVSVLLIVLSTISAPHAHVTGTGLATLGVEGERAAWRLTLPLHDIAGDPGRDVLRAAEGHAPSAERVRAILHETMALSAGDAPCPLERIEVLGSRLDEARAIVEIDFRCPTAPGVIHFRDAFAQRLGEHYRTLLTVAGEGRDIVFDSETTEARIDLGQGGGIFGSLVVVALGMAHILSGPDHVLFLVVLLAAAGGFWRVLGIVTAFTAAHSLTLTLAALGLVIFPSHIVEPLIAGSIVWIAAENLLGRNQAGYRWLVTFLFGLVHGFGFASALAEIETARLGLVWTLIGFNLGVEFGQALVVIAVFPLILWLKRQARGPEILRGFSALTLIVGLIWLIERAFFA